MNITDPSAEQQELGLNCSTAYDFQVKAWNELGGGVYSSVQSATTESATTQDDNEGLSTSGTHNPFVISMNLTVNVFLINLGKRETLRTRLLFYGLHVKKYETFFILCWCSNTI